MCTPHPCHAASGRTSGSATCEYMHGDTCTHTTNVHTRTHTQLTYAQTHTHTHTHTHKYKHTHTYTHKRTHTHTQTHSLTNVHTHTHAQSEREDMWPEGCSPVLSWPVSLRRGTEDCWPSVLSSSPPHQRDGLEATATQESRMEGVRTYEVVVAKH